MSFLDVMQTYFHGEKIEAVAFIIPVGIILVAFGAVALKAERGGFAWGVAIPCFLFGLVLIGTGTGIAWRTPGQVVEIKKGFQETPAAMLQKELPRMQKVNSNFKASFIGFGISAAIGLVLIFLVRSDWAKGLGSVLILVGSIGFLIDGFASRRAIPYTSALVELAEQHHVAQGNGR